MKLESLEITTPERGQAIQWSYVAHKYDLSLLAQSFFNVTEKLSWDSELKQYRMDAEIKSSRESKSRSLTCFLNTNGQAVAKEGETKQWNSEIVKLDDDSFEKRAFADFGTSDPASFDFMVGDGLNVRFKRAKE